MTTNGPDVTLYADQQLPATALTWLDADGNRIALHTGHTFALELVDGAGYIRKTKTTGITGENNTTNVHIAWVSADLTGLSGLYRMRVIATETATGKRRVFRPENPPVVWVRPAPTAPPAV